MTLLFSALGGLLLAVVVHDVFHTSFHPRAKANSAVSSSRGLASGPVGGGSTRLAELAGPPGMAAVIGTGGSGVVLGGALVYWPRIDRFSYSAGLDPDARADFLDALYLSLGRDDGPGGDGGM